MYKRQPPGPLAVFRGSTSKGRGGRGRDCRGRGDEERGGRKLALCPRKKKENSAAMTPPPVGEPSIAMSVSVCLCSLVRAVFKGGSRVPEPQAAPTNRGPPTKPFIFYFSLMIDAYEATT